MSGERTASHPAAPVHFEHWCEHPGCREGEASGSSATSPNRTVSVWSIDRRPIAACRCDKAWKKSGKTARGSEPRSQDRLGGERGSFMGDEASGEKHLRVRACNLAADQ
jgi:hypothetical protein